MCASVGTPLASTASPSFVQRSSRESSASSLTWSRKTEVWLDQPQGRGHSLALKAINDALETRLGHIVPTNRPCDSRDSISPSFDTYTNVLNDLTAIFRPIAVFMRSTLRLGRRALHSVELSRTRVAKAIRFSEVQETNVSQARNRSARHRRYQPAMFNRAYTVQRTWTETIKTLDRYQRNLSLSPLTMALL